jgi:glycosyltransferase involved in cell wall biosynthesis
MNVHLTSSPAPLFYPLKQTKLYKITALQFLFVPGQVGRKQTFYHCLATSHKAKTADFIIANSHYTKNKILNLIGTKEDKIEVIYEAVDHDVFNKKYPKKNHWDVLAEKFSINFNFILFVSDLRPYKNPFILIKAYEGLLNDTKIDEDLLIIGNSILGYGDVLKQYVSNSPYKSRIHFLPFQ